MKILYYNWAAYNSSQGGGVTVYQRNLIEELTRRPGVEVTFLSAGNVYSPFTFRPFIRPSVSGDIPGCRSFEIVNSPVPAPGSLLYNNLRRYLNLRDRAVVNLVADFIRGQGGFDVIHFNNIEGLPLNILALKELFPQTKIIFTLHNYFLFCPLIQLFQNHHHCNCRNFDNGRQCLLCRYKKITPDVFVGKMESYLGTSPLWLRAVIKPWLFLKSRLLARFVLSRRRQRNRAEDFARFRRFNIAMINRNVDRVLAVSERVKTIALEKGIRPELLTLGYIGTRVAERAYQSFSADFSKSALAESMSPAVSSARSELADSLRQLKKTPRFLPHSSITLYQEPMPRPFSIAYLGYARIDKGFYFMLEALNRLDTAVASGIRLVLAARRLDAPYARDLINRLSGRLLRLEIYDGYTHQQLPELLSGINLGIVPVIWEDNLPQVAIEFCAHKVPVLASNLGGASELCASPLFRFQAGNIEDFNRHLTYLIQNPAALDEYWRHQRPLVTMSAHLNQLLKQYRLSASH